MGRSRTNLERTMTEVEIDQFATLVSTAYATSGLEFSRDYFTKAFNITSSCFYWLRDRSIIRDLVSDEMVDKMRTKSSANSNRKSRENANVGTAASEAHYARLIGKRRWFIYLRDFPKEKKIEITTYFAEHPKVSKEECAKQFGLSKVALDKIIEDTLIKNEVDDEIFSKIRKRSLGNDPSKIAINYFANLKRKRNKNKKTAS